MYSLYSHISLFRPEGIIGLAIQGRADYQLKQLIETSYNLSFYDRINLGRKK